MIKIKNIATMLLVLFSLTHCNEETQKTMGLKAIPNAFGDINELVIVADKDTWDGPMGDTIRFYYSSAYPILPQPEPILDLRFFTPEQLNGAPDRKELRNYLIVANLKDGNSSTTQLVAGDIGQEKIRQARENSKFNTVVGRDKWAKGQLIIYQFGRSYNELMENVKTNFPAILKRINKADRDRLDATVYFKGQSYKLMQELKNTLGVQLRIPEDYFLAMNKEGVMWMRKETQKVSSNIMITKMPFKDKEQLSKSYIKSVRDSLGKYVSTAINNTYMKINDKDLPMLSKPIKLANQYTVEARGIWEIQNDYMGGAFVSFLIHDPNNDELVFIDGFVHAPGEDKRDLMMQLEHILKTVKL